MIIAPLGQRKNEIILSKFAWRSFANLYLVWSCFCLYLVICCVQYLTFKSVKRILPDILSASRIIFFWRLCMLCLKNVWSYRICSKYVWRFRIWSKCSLSRWFVAVSDILNSSSSVGFWRFWMLLLDKRVECGVNTRLLCSLWWCGEFLVHQATRICDGI